MVNEWPPEVGIHKRKQESKNRENTLLTKKEKPITIKKKRNTLSTKKVRLKKNDYDQEKKKEGNGKRKL